MADFSPETGSAANAPQCPCGARLEPEWVLWSRQIDFCPLHHRRGPEYSRRALLVEREGVQVSMSRKHYVALATVIRDSTLLDQSQREGLAEEFADTLDGVARNFDRGLFVAYATSTAGGK